MADKKDFNYDITWEEMTAEQRENFSRFIVTTMAYSDEELNALAGDTVKMDFEIFLRCLTKCALAHNKNEFKNICESYPEFYDRLANGLDELDELYKD